MAESSSLQVSTLDGCRLIEIVWPAHPEPAALRDFVFALYDLWDEGIDTPSVSINDVRGIGEMTPDEFEIARIILGRMRMHPSFVAGAFFVGTNETARDGLARALEAAKRPVESLCTTRDEAVEYLRREIAAFATRNG